MTGMHRPDLGALLHPRSIALIGGSARPGSLGTAVLDNIIDAGFRGPIHVVNLAPVARPGAHWSESIASLPEAPDLAILCTPAETIPDLIDALGLRGTRVAIVLSGNIHDAGGVRSRMLAAADRHHLRIVGPNSIGVLSPHAQLNASFARGMPPTGGVALIAQSGAVAATLVDWAAARSLGVSAIISAGDVADLDIGDLVTLVADDPHTRTILIHLEGLTHAGKFLSAASTAARTKPIVAIKGGRGEDAGKAAQSHSGALAGHYDVYCAALRDAGIILVDRLADLFGAAAILSGLKPLTGDRLAIITNGGGAAVLALDALAGTGAALARLSPSTYAALDRQLPTGWSHANPIDLIGDADARRYEAAIEIVAADPAVDAVLVINCPTALARGEEIAHAAAARLQDLTKPSVACWLGGRNFAGAAPHFARTGIPLFDTVEDAVQAFGVLAASRLVPAALAERVVPWRSPQSAPEAARRVIAEARREGRVMLSEVEAKAILASYEIPIVETRFAATVGDIASACDGLAGRLVVKIVSPQLSHKSDIGGVALDLENAGAATAAAAAMIERVACAEPEATISGFAIEPMVERANAYELAVGIADDATFGPVLVVAAGGTAIELLHDRALALPPLDPSRARAMIGRTRIAARLAGYRNVPPADIESLVAALGAVSRIATELPDICELDINPLLVSPDGSIALDARIRLRM